MSKIATLFFLGALASISMAQILLFEETDVFVGGQDDINTYHIL
jgi:hypothetical protein